MKNVKITFFSNYEKKKMYDENQKHEIRMLIKEFHHYHNIKSKTFNEKWKNNKLRKSWSWQISFYRFKFVDYSKQTIAKHWNSKLKKLKSKTINLMSEQTNFRAESLTWLDRKWWVRILFRHFATEVNPWSRCAGQ